MCRYLWWFYTTHETTIKHWHFDRKGQSAHKFLVFSRVFFALIMCRYLWWFYTTHETTIKHWHFDRKGVIAHRFLVFSRFFLALIMYRYLPCSLALRNLTRKHLPFCQISLLFSHIQGNLWCFVSFNRRCKRMHFYVPKRNFFVDAKNT